MEEAGLPKDRIKTIRRKLLQVERSSTKENFLGEIRKKYLSR